MELNAALAPLARVRSEISRESSDEQLSMIAADRDMETYRTAQGQMCMSPAWSGGSGSNDSDENTGSGSSDGSFDAESGHGGWRGEMASMPAAGWTGPHTRDSAGRAQHVSTAGMPDCGEGIETSEHGYRARRTEWAGSGGTTQVRTRAPPAQGDHGRRGMVAHPSRGQWTEAAKSDLPTYTLPQFDGRRNHNADGGTYGGQGGAMMEEDASVTRPAVQDTCISSLPPALLDRQSTPADQAATMMAQGTLQLSLPLPLLLPELTANRLFEAGRPAEARGSLDLMAWPDTGDNTAQSIEQHIADQTAAAGGVGGMWDGHQWENAGETVDRALHEISFR